MELICINCPRGCKLNVVSENGKIEVIGNLCSRGQQYAISEITNPLRTVTTTVKIVSNKCERLPVISSEPLNKDMVMDVMKTLKNIEVKAPIRINDVVIRNILNLNVDIIASKTIDE